MIKFLRFLSVFIAGAVLTACHPFGTANLETPAPLVKFTPTAKVVELWRANVGTGSKDEALRFALGYDNGLVYTTDMSGDIDAINAQTGKPVWRTTISSNVVSGVGVGAGIVVVGTDDGQAVALDAKTGKQKWAVDIGNQLLAVPQIQQGIVIVKTVADSIYALDASSGRQLWSFVTSAPTLILRFGSTPQIAGDIIYSGMANGRLAALTLQMGLIRWQQQIAMPRGANDVQQMVDIDADPVLLSQHVYVATYQGSIAALNMSNGKPIWSHKLSTYTGLVADNKAVYVTDAKGYVWSFAAESGAVNWRQTKLRARGITAPISMGDYLVIADAEGYVHWINKQTGEFTARVAAQPANGFLSKPLVVGKQVFVLTNDGELLGYQVNS